jgi:hypothetical protein
MSDSNSRPRPITLTKLEDTDYYQLWCTTAKSTFDLHNALHIVLGTEPRSASAEDDETVLVNWDQRHKLAKEALLSALKPAQLLRVSRLETAFEIWKRLEDEYGQISDLKRAQLDAKLRSLRKADNKTMKVHIDEFESIRQKIEFHSAEPMSAKDVNVAFLISLGDSDTWKNYRNANLYRTVNMRTVDLIAEVSLIDDSSTPTVSSPTLPSSFEGSEARALTTSFSYQGRSQRGGFRGSYRGNYRGGRGGNNNRGGRHLRPPFNADGYCEGCQKRGHQVEEYPTKCNYCKEHGHLIDNCFKLKWVNEQRFSKRDDNGENGNGNMDMQYTPSFQRPG